MPTVRHHGAGGLCSWLGVRVGPAGGPGGTSRQLGVLVGPAWGPGGAGVPAGSIWQLRVPSGKGPKSGMAAEPVIPEFLPAQAAQLPAWDP